jgi:putative Holliday junction resolvase
VKPVGRRRKEAAEDSAILTPTDMREGPEGWTDYTRYALGMEDDSEADQSTGGVKRVDYLGKYDIVERKRAIGVDFGPTFTGLAMSLGSVNSLPLGTLETGSDWKEAAIKICQIASTRRAEDIVLGLPLEKDGTDGGIAILVRHFAQIVSDTALLMLGGEVSVYLWDERFSTAYAAMRLVTRPQMENGAFKSWLDGQRGLDYSSKALLDSEAARSILEHWLEGDPGLGKLNKDKSERVPPTKEAVRAYLLWKKNPLSRVKQRPVEPQGMGKEAFEWYDLNQESARDDYDFLMEQRENYTKVMKAQEWFGHKEFEKDKKKIEARKDRARTQRAIEKNKQDDTELRKNLQSSMDMRKLRPSSSMPQR